MDNELPKVTEDQSITYISCEALVRDVHVRLSERNSKTPQWFDPVE